MQTNPFSSGSLPFPGEISVRPAKTRPRVVFIVCEAGGGHHSAARAITQALHHRFPDFFETDTVNIEDMIGPLGRLLGTLYVESYNLALRHGHYWMEPWIFNSLSLSRQSLLSIGLPYFRKALSALRPDMVVMLIHGAHDVMDAALKADGYIPNLTVVTDAVTIRDSWVHPYCDQMIVSTEAAAQACMVHGIRPDRLEILGHPMHINFALPRQSRQALARQYGIAPEHFTLLIMMGGAGGKNILRFSRQLAQSGLPIQIIAVCGKDQRLFKQMQTFAEQSPVPIYPFGFTSEIPALMTLADVVITKPGPGTMMEALACGRPIILDDSNYTMYQEQGNVAYVRDHQLGIVLDRSDQLIPAVKNLLENQELYQTMQNNTLQHNRSDAGLRIAEQIHTRLADPARMWHRE